MAWETRGRGVYYYQKIRMGRRVVSRYFGGGPAAFLQATTDLQMRAEQAARREQLIRIKNEQKNLDQVVQRQRELTQAVIWLCLRAAGYHCHRGSWRRRRKSDGHPDAASR